MFDPRDLQLRKRSLQQLRNSLKYHNFVDVIFAPFSSYFLKIRL